MSGVREMRETEMHVTAKVIRPQAQWRAQAELPTRFGTFSLNVFTEEAPDGGGVREHVAMVFGDLENIRNANGLLVRVHSECMTSEVFGSLKCDCREQLDGALAEIARQGAGMVLRQEGRGIGLLNKIRAYELQARGHDTVDANRMLGLPDDTREYGTARDMLDYFGVRSIRLLTNNPEKVKALRALGVRVDERVPVLVEPNAFSGKYLETKRTRMAHWLPAYGNVGAGAAAAAATATTATNVDPDRE